MPRQIPLSKARDHLPALIRDAESGDTIQLTRRGQPVAVLLSNEEYARLRQGHQENGFFEALLDFRQNHRLDRDDADAGEWDNLRDRSTGRPVEL